MQFSLRRLLLAFPWFALASFVLAQHVQFEAHVQAAAAQGRFVCGTCALGLEPCLPAAVAGIATLLGQRWTAVIVGAPTAAWIALWVLGGML